MSDAHTICAIFVVRWISSKALDRHETTHLLLIINGIFFWKNRGNSIVNKKLNYSTLTRELLTQLKAKLLFSPAILTIITILFDIHLWNFDRFFENWYNSIKTNVFDDANITISFVQLYYIRIKVRYYRNYGIHS